MKKWVIVSIAVGAYLAIGVVAYVLWPKQTSKVAVEKSYQKPDYLDNTLWMADIQWNGAPGLFMGGGMIDQIPVDLDHVNIANFQDEELVRLVQARPNIRRLAIVNEIIGGLSSTVNHASANGYKVVLNLPKLERLSFHMVFNLSDDLLEAIAKSPTIRSIRLVYCGDYTSKGINALKAAGIEVVEEQFYPRED